MTNRSADSIAKPRRIPYGMHWVGEEEYQEVQKTLETGYLTMGPRVELFEKELKNYTGAEHVVAVSSCSAALHLALLAHGIGPGDEVITTVWTFVATSNAILHVGATPVFVDADERSCNLDVRQIEKKITPKTKAIIPVHFAGHPAPMKEVREIAKKHNLLIIEDCAHAIGAKYQNEMIGSKSTAACFSFHPVKNMTTAEGGAVATNSKEVADKIRAMRLHGIATDFFKREKAGDVAGYPQMQYLGFKYNMTDVQAALGLHQLPKLDKFIKRREEIANIYYSELKNLEELTLAYLDPGVKHAWHLFTVRVHLDKLKISRDALMEKLAEKSVITGVHYLPVHRHRYYAERFGFKLGDFPAADALYDSMLSIPLYPKMTQDDAEYVVKTIREVLDENRR